MSTKGPEYDDCQLPAIALLREQFGYAHAKGSSLAGESGVLLVERLARALRRINMGLDDAGVAKAIDDLRAPVAGGLLEANSRVHRLLSRWTTVDQKEGKNEVGRSVYYFDFEDVSKNEFLVAEELTASGVRKSPRLDLVVYVNGIPLAVIECKDPADPRGMESAVADLLAYQDAQQGVPRLFASVHFCIALKKHDARYGTIETPMDRYAQWKSAFPMSEFDLGRRIGREPTAQDILLAGLLAPANLLDHLRNFVAFETKAGKTVKKLARYQQFEAVNRTIAQVASARSADGQAAPMRDRGGVIWHTQGSGKSLTMLWLAVKLKREKSLDNPTILIVTDRTDLDRQITGTFKNCGFPDPVQAKRITHLRTLLKSEAPGQTVLTTVQKFQDEVDDKRGSRHPVLSRAENLITLVDEAHRTEYGLFGAHLRKALPGAALVAFTGTPIPKTLMKFGPYIHKYTIQQSEADGATVPILYESRLPELSVWGSKWLDTQFANEFSELSEEQRKKLHEQELREVRIAEAGERIEMVAADIAQHFRENFLADGFKAQVAACSQDAAGRYFAALDRAFPGQVAVLIADRQRKDDPLAPLRERFADEAAIVKEFVEDGADDALKFLIVVDKYLTGFDAPIERVLYLDKSLKEHNLLQAIARVNRPLPEKDKKWGLIVDYWGVSKFLDKALAGLGDEVAVTQVMSRRMDDLAYEELKQRRADVMAMFPRDLGREDVTPWLEVLEPEDHRSRFLRAYRAFYQVLERLLPDERALKFIGDFAWLRRLRQEMTAYFSEEDLVVPEASEKVRKLIDKHVKAEEIRLLLAPVPILSEQFTQEVDKLTSSRAKASRMKNAIAKTITVKLHEDPAFYESLRERLERIIDERKHSRIDDAREYGMLVQLHGKLREGAANDAEHMGLSENEHAFYGLLATAGAGQSPESRANIAKQLVQTLSDGLVLDWVQKEDVQREMRRRLKRELRMADWPDETIEALVTRTMDLARTRMAR